MRPAWIAGIAAALLALMGALPAPEVAAQVAAGTELTRGARPTALAVDPHKRVALVIGVDGYAHKPLKNPVRDARAMARELRQLGFDVVVVEDGRRIEVLKALQSLRERLQGASLGLFFFAGHGVQIGGRNFLIPRDVDMGVEEQVVHNALSLDEVLQVLGTSGVVTKVVILDACRNNPFATSGGAKGLAPPGAQGKDLLVAYATEPGQVASDGDEGTNGRYTAQVLSALQTPGLTLEEVFRRVRGGVLKASDGRQIPWETTSLTGRVVLREGPVPGTAPPAAGGTAPAPMRSLAQLAERPGERFRDCAACPEMVVVPAGRFIMGSPQGEAGRHPREGPQQEVTIARPYAVARLELTRAQWNACLLDGSVQGDEPGLRCTHWPGAGPDDAPLGGLTWEDAQTYVRWLARRTGRPYRLLSEAEWEHAARAGSTTARPWGDDVGLGQAVCRECGGPAPAGPLLLPPAGPRSEPRWGLHDMLGNLWEWVADCRSSSLQGQPADGSARTDGDCAERGIRGGSWLTQAKGVRSAGRSFLPVGRREGHVGLRVGMSLDEGRDRP